MIIGFNWSYYEGYFDDDVTFFDTATLLSSSNINGNSVDGTNISTLTNNYVNFNFDNKSFEWFGYFIPDVTGNYTFYTNSDDASYLWLADNAINN